jgi:hypothetical protein
MERKSMENIWKGNAWKIYGKGKHGKYMERKSTENIWKGGKYKDDSALVEKGGISDSMGWEIGQYASWLCSGDYQPCWSGGFVLWGGGE